MKSLQALREKRDQLAARAEAIVALAEEENARELTAEEKSEIDTINGSGDKPGQLDALDADIGRLEKIEARQKAIVKTRVEASRNDISDAFGREIAVPSSAVRGSLKAFKGPNAEKDAYISGQYLCAALFKNQKARDWLSERGIDIRAAHSTTDNEKGGYLVPDPMESSIIRLVEEYGRFRANVGRVWPMPNGNIRVPKRSGGFTSYYVSENTAITASDMAFASVSLVAKKLGVLTQISSELLEDSAIMLADVVATEMAYAFALAEDQAGFLGDGTATYGGITGLANALNDSAIVTTATNVDTFGELTIATAHEAMGKLARYAGIMPKWYMHSSAWANAFERLSFAAGGNTMTNFAQGMAPNFAGYPVEFVQVLPSGSSTTDHSGAIIAYFGDLSMAAAMGDARGITIAASEHHFFAEDAIAMRATERFDINIHDRGTTTASDQAGAIVGLKLNAS